MQIKFLRQLIGRTVEFSREMIGWVLITPNEQRLVTGTGERWGVIERR
jgi:hypothetical protein